MKRGFTIVELMVSVGIIAVLLTIVIVAAGGAQSAVRKDRREAMRVALEQGITAFYAELGEWPRAIESRIDSTQGSSCVFKGSEADEIFREVIAKAYGSSKGAKVMLVDVSALFVAESASLKDPSRVFNHSGRGLDLSQMRVEGEDAQDAINRLSFGYPCVKHGRFCRFWVKYNVKSDSVEVHPTPQDFEDDGYHGCTAAN